MTRSVEEIRRDSEQSRAQLAATVDRLRDQITDTAEDIRYKVSPEGIKAEVSGFISHKTQGWLDGLKQQAMDNPMQAIAAGTAIAVPALRLARGFPLPLLMIGAGLALSSKTVRDRAAEAAAPGVEKAREVMGETTARAQSLGDGVRRAISDAERQAAGMASEAQDTTSGIADAAGEVASDLKDRAAQTVDAVTGKVRAGIDAASEKAKGTIERARSTANDAATAAPAAASKLIRDNAALIGGLGVAIGAILAASLPSTRAEAGVMGKASDRVKRAASTATQSGFEAAKDTVLSAADAVAKSVADADLGKHASRITEDVTERLKEVADDVVTTAFDPSRNPHS
jgi:gas vesicle protein